MKITKPVVSSAQQQAPVISQDAAPTGRIAAPGTLPGDTLVSPVTGGFNPAPGQNVQTGGFNPAPGIGRPQTQQGVPSTGGFNPAPGLSPDEIARIAGVGAEGLKGRGTLQGKIDVQNGKAYLITANEGSRSAVRFALDVKSKDVKALIGQTVSVSGMLEKTSQWGGKITGADVVTGVQGSSGQAFGEHIEVKGTIKNKNIMGIGGEAPPSGSYLVLDKPVIVGGTQYTEALVWSLGDLADGTQLHVHGRLDKHTYGGVETAGGSVLELTGISNLAKGEPRSVDGKFFNAGGAELAVLTDPRPSYYDAPMHLFVLDGSDVFLGRSGGHMPPDRNPFHGFVGKAQIESPTAADQGKVTFDADGVGKNAAGEELFVVGENPGGDHPDAMSSRWLLDNASSTVYRFDNGGFAGFNNHLSAVIHLPTE